MATIKQKTERGVEVAWAAATTLQTAALEADLRKLNDDGLVIAFGHLRDAGRKAFLGLAIVVGIAQERAEKGDCVLDRLSQALGRHRSRIAVLGQIYRQIVKPRILELGEKTEFLVDDAVYFETAVRFAGRNAFGNANALELLSIAEDAKMSDSSFSGRRFIESIALDPEVTEGSLTLSTKKISRAMEGLQRVWAEDGFRNWCDAHPNPGWLAGMLEDVGTAFLKQAKNLKKRKSSS